MSRYCYLDELTASQLEKYNQAIPLAFPEIIVRSQHIKNYWPKLEKYFPRTQLYLIDNNDELIGFMNTIPFHWDKLLNELPDQGWDWMLQKGVEDYENGIKANTLGGLQVIVRDKYQKKGYSQLIISQVKLLMKKLGFESCVIPIRPILKHKHPEIPMIDYMKLMQKDKIYDPWIRTHINSGAKILGVCSESMKVYGNMSFWDELYEGQFTESGFYQIEGALNPIKVNLEKDYGEYLEENIWLMYN